MAYQQQFGRLLQQINEANARNLQLESLLAQKDEQLTHLQRSLTNPLSGSGSVGGNGAPPHGYDFELQKANKRAAHAEASLQSSIDSFDKAYKDLQKQIRTLKGEADAARHTGSKGPSTAEDKSKIASLKNELKETKAKLENLQAAHKGLQRQFQVEKRENEKFHPATASEKADYFQNDDQDDEESPPLMKQEPASRNNSSASVMMLDGPPPPSDKRASQSSAVGSRKNSTASNINVNLAHRPKQMTVVKPIKRNSSASQHKQIKRRRSSRDEDEDYTNEDTDSARDDLPPARKRTRGSRVSITIDMTNTTNDYSDLKRGEKNFPFQAITSWPKPDEPGSDKPDSFYEVGDLDDCVEALWERIRQVVNLWEEKCDDWKVQFDALVEKSNSVAPFCVSSKMKIEGRENAKTSWRDGSEGKHACQQCVEANLPCFTWTEEAGFRLLPLHKHDRKYPDKKEVEIRTWLNEE